MENVIEKNDVIIINEGQTVVVTSKLCGESFCFTAKDDGIEGKALLTTERKTIESKCKKEGYPSQFVYVEPNKDSCAYVISAKSESGIALCVEEVYKDSEFHLLLSKVHVREWVSSKNKDGKHFYMDYWNLIDIKR